MVKPKVKTQRKALNKKRIKARFKALKGSYVKVGFPANGSVGSSDSGEAHSDTMSEIALIAVYNNFGTDTIPAREFMSSSYRKALPKTRQMQIRCARAVVKGRMSLKTALGMVGELNVEEMKMFVRDLKLPPNAESTKRRKKGADNPLINFGQMINSIQHEVVVS